MGLEIIFDRAKKNLSATPKTQYSRAEMRFFSKRKSVIKNKAAIVAKEIYDKMVKMHNSYFSMIACNSDGFQVSTSEEFNSPHGTIFHYTLEETIDVFFSIHSVDRFAERCGIKPKENYLPKDVCFSSETALDDLCTTTLNCLHDNDIWFNRIGKSELYVKIGDNGILSIHKIKEAYLVKTFMTIDMVKCNHWRELSNNYTKLYRWLDRAFELTDEVKNV